MPPKVVIKKLPPLQVKRFYVVVPSDATSEKVIDSIESAHSAALAFVNGSPPVANAAIETTHINGVVCCSVWHRPLPAAAAPVAKSSPAAKPAKKASVSPASAVAALAADGAASSGASGGVGSTSSASSDVELKTLSAPAGTAAPAAAKKKAKKPTLVVPAKYAGSKLRVGMKQIDLAAGENGDSASVQLICHVGDDKSEHSFTAKKTTLAALGYADMEAGSVNLKELVLLSMHFIVDEAGSKLADIPRALTPESLHELFPAYSKTVAKPDSQAAQSGGSCTIQ